TSPLLIEKLCVLFRLHRTFVLAASAFPRRFGDAIDRGRDPRAIRTGDAAQIFPKHIPESFRDGRPMVPEQHPGRHSDRESYEKVLHDLTSKDAGECPQFAPKAK